MHILFDIHGYPPVLNAGAEFYAHSLAKYLVSQGHKVTVLLSPTRDDAFKCEYTFETVYVTIKPTPEEVDSFYSTADVVLTHLDRTRQCIVRAKKHHVPIVHIVHNTAQLSAVQEDEAQLLIYNAISTAKAVRYPCPSILLYPVVDVKAYKTDLTKPRDKYALINMNENKGGNIFWSLADEFPDRQFLAQKGGYGPQIIRDNVNANVTVRDPDPDMRLVYAQTHVLLVPSEFETFGRVAIEAACSGIPILANPTPGLREALGVSGALWPRRGNFQEWYSAIKMLDDPEVYAHMSRNAYNRALYLEQKSEIQLKATEYALQTLCYTERRKVFSIASEPQYLDHLAPIIHSLPLEHVGPTVIYTNGHNNFDKLEEKAYEHNLTVLPNPNQALYIDNALSKVGSFSQSLLLVASWRDQLNATRGSMLKDRMVRTEHGAGQAYSDSTSPSFPGGSGHKGLQAALVPGERAALAIRSKNPQLPVAGIGCPKLDWLKHFPRKKNEKLTVAISFRYNSNSDCNEMEGAFDDFKVNVAEMVSNSPEIAFIGHCHPFAAPSLIPWYNALKVPYEPDFERILTTADILVVDNSSIAFEWLLTQRPHAALGLMNSFKYRTFMDHGMRFWELDKEPDVVAFNPGDLTAQALKHLPEVVRNIGYGEMMAKVYEVPLGNASVQARDTLLQLINREPADDLIKVAYNKTMTAGSGLRKRGEIYWLNKNEAEFLHEHKAATIIGTPDPMPLGAQPINMDGKEDWDVSNFARYYQLVIPRNRGEESER